MKFDKLSNSQHEERVGIVLLKITTPSVRNNVQYVSYGILKWGSVCYRNWIMEMMFAS